MTRLVIVLAALVMISGVAPAVAQTSLRLEAGLGVGRIGEGGGSNVRLGFGLVAGNWGGLVRLVRHTGAEGVREPAPDIISGEGIVGGILGALFAGQNRAPRESFEEVSILVTRSLAPHSPHTVLLSAGIGTISGRRIDPADGVGLKDLGKTWGVPLELALYGGDGRGFEGSLVLSAHINSEAPQFGLGVVVMFGWFTRGAAQE